MLKKGLDTLAIFSLSLSILTDCIGLFIAINLQKNSRKDEKKQKRSDKKVKDDLQELQHEISLLKSEAQKRTI